jgi:kynurenine formamidase
MTAGNSYARLVAAFAECDVVDLSPLVEPGMPGWPTHPVVDFDREARTIEQHGYYAQTLILPEHSGCHVDAPAHLGCGATVDEMTVDALVGPAKKLDLSHEGLAPGETLSYARYCELLEESALTVNSGDIVLFDFGWDRHYHEETSGAIPKGWWGSNEPGLDDDICRTLHEAGIRAVGSDTAGCDIAERDAVILSSPGHSTWFLPQGIPIIEGLQGLHQAPAEFVFVGLPLRVSHGSGSPLRAVGLVPRTSHT